MTNDPCKFCSDYPRICRGLCVSKMKYLNEVDERTEVVKPNRIHRRLVVETNKNGIRREIYR